MLECRLDRQTMRQVAERYEVERSLTVAKFAVAAFVLDELGNILVCEHDTRQGESTEGALGSVTETLRYLYDDDDHTETPLEGLARCLFEEHGIDDAELREAGFFFDIYPPITFGEWVPGRIEGTNVAYPCFNIVVKVEDRDVFLQGGRPSEEILSAKFMNAEALLADQSPRRPGYNAWLETMIAYTATNEVGNHEKVVWPNLPKTSKDARAPF